MRIERVFVRLAIRRREAYRLHLKEVRIRFLLLTVTPLVLAAQPMPYSVPAECQVRQAEDFVPMTRTERGAFYIRSLLSPPAGLETAARAGIEQGANRQAEWQQGVTGFSRRLGSDYAERILAESFEHGFAFGLHEDNRYFASGRHGVWRRLCYAVSSSVLARHDDGSRRLSLSAIGGTAAGAFLARQWQPRSTSSSGDAAVSFGLTFGVDACFNIMREFSPRVLGRIL